LGISKRGFNPNLHTLQAKDIEWTQKYTNLPAVKTDEYAKSLGVNVPKTLYIPTGYIEARGSEPVTLVVLVVRETDPVGETFVQCIDVTIPHDLVPVDNDDDDESQLPPTLPPSPPPVIDDDDETGGENCPVHHAKMCQCAGLGSAGSSHILVHAKAEFGEFCQCVNIDGTWFDTNPHTRLVWGANCHYEGATYKTCFSPASVYYSTREAESKNCKIHF
jgi:hypothetical protein